MIIVVVNICIYIYTHICCVYIYIYTHIVCMYVCIYIYIYIYTLSLKVSILMLEGSGKIVRTVGKGDALVVSVEERGVIILYYVIV